MTYVETRLHSRDFDLFMGIAQRLANKPQLDESDLEFIDRWLGENPRAVAQPVLRPITDFIAGSPWDQLASVGGLAALHSLLRKLCGDTNDDGVPDGPTAIAYTDPPPAIAFSGMRFCFTGTFLYGGRKKCEQAVLALGARVDDIAQSTDYLVVGSRVTDSWKHSSFGRKISKAMEWNVNVVKEEDWRAALDGCKGAHTASGQGASTSGSNAGKKFWQSSSSAGPAASYHRAASRLGAWKWCQKHWKSLAVLSLVSGFAGWFLA